MRKRFYFFAGGATVCTLLLSFEVDSMMKYKTPGNDDFNVKQGTGLVPPSCNKPQKMKVPDSDLGTHYTDEDGRPFYVKGTDAAGTETQKLEVVNG